MSNKIIYDHKGNIYKSIKEKCDAYNIEPSHYLKRIERGWSEEDALLGKVLWVIEGKEYRSKVDIINDYNLTRSTLNKYLSLGFNIEDIIKMKKKPIKDHKGNIYKSIPEKCKAYNINESTYKTRIISGWSEEDALTKPIQKKGRSRKEDGNQ